MSRITLLYIDEGFSFEVWYMKNIQGQRQKLNTQQKALKLPFPPPIQSSHFYSEKLWSIGSSSKAWYKIEPCLRWQSRQSNPRGESREDLWKYINRQDIQNGSSWELLQGGMSGWTPWEMRYCTQGRGGGQTCKARQFVRRLTPSLPVCACTWACLPINYSHEFPG